MTSKTVSASVAPVLIAASALTCTDLNAQNFPNRPLRLVVPFPAGESIDVTARAITQHWSNVLNQQIVVDNRPGAGGTIGTELAAKAARDGYTMVYGNAGPMSIGPNLYPKLGYDLFKDLAPVTQATTSPFMLFSSAALPVNSVAELISLAKAKPGTLNFASTGVGSGLHLSGELFKLVAGINIVHVPFKGIGQAMPEIVAGRIQLAMGTPPGMVQHVKAGRMKALVNTGLKRSALLPDVPTGAEVGLPKLIATSWHGIMVPAGTPDALARVLQESFVKAAAIPELRDQLVNQLDAAPVGTTAEEFGRFLRAESDKWAAIIKSASVKIE